MSESRASAKPGGHVCSAADFGLDPETPRRTFAGYIKTCPIPIA
jgi:hypothetical protein